MVAAPSAALVADLKERGLLKDTLVIWGGEFGRTPMNHLTHLRIQQAIRLISESDDKLAVIARRVGFANGNSFSSAFKKSTGHAPSHFRAEA